MAMNSEIKQTKNKYYYGIPNILFGDLSGFFGFKYFPIHIML